MIVSTSWSTEHFSWILWRQPQREKKTLTIWLTIWLSFFTSEICPVRLLNRKPIPGDKLCPSGFILYAKLISLLLDAHSIQTGELWSLAKRDVSDVVFFFSFYTFHCTMYSCVSITASDCVSFFSSTLPLADDLGRVPFSLPKAHQIQIHVRQLCRPCLQSRWYLLVWRGDEPVPHRHRQVLHRPPPATLPGRVQARLEEH